MSPLRDQRISKQQDFAKIFAKRQIIAGKYLKIYYLQTNDAAKLAMAINKKFVKTGIQFNRVRRQIREEFRLRKDKLQNLSIVVSLKEKVLTKDLIPEIRKEVKQHLSKLEKLIQA